MKINPTCSILEVSEGNDEKVFIFTGQNGLDEGDAPPSSGIIVTDKYFTKILTHGNLLKQRSCHKQQSIKNAL